jgi:hypothetical protein
MPAPSVALLNAQRDTLLQESILAASAIANGLTSFRRYSFADKGAFFSGLFLFTIGLERILKLIVILDHWQTNGTLPANQELRTFSHGLDALLQKARDVNTCRSLSVDMTDLDDALVTQIVRIITEFAKRSRYYNLDSVSGNATAQVEPLAQWDAAVAAEIVRRHDRPTAARRADLAFAAALRSVRGIVVYHSADDGTRIQDVESLARNAALIETKQKYGTFYLHRLVEFTVALLERLDDGPGTSLGLGEPFRAMSCVPRAMALRRKISRPCL